MSFLLALNDATHFGGLTVAFGEHGHSLLKHADGFGAMDPSETWAAPVFQDRSSFAKA